MFPPIFLRVQRSTLLLSFITALLIFCAVSPAWTVSLQRPALWRQTCFSGPVAWSPTGNLLAAAQQTVIVLINPADGATIRILDGNAAAIEAMIFSPDGQTLATGDAECTVKVWSVNDGTLLKTLPKQTGMEHIKAFSPDGKSFATIRLETVTLWRLEDGVKICSFTSRYSRPIFSVAFHSGRAISRCRQ